MPFSIFSRMKQSRSYAYETAQKNVLNSILRNCRRRPSPCAQPPPPRRRHPRRLPPQLWRQLGGRLVGVRSPRRRRLRRRRRRRRLRRRRRRGGLRRPAGLRVPADNAGRGRRAGTRAGRPGRPHPPGPPGAPRPARPQRHSDFDDGGRKEEEKGRCYGKFCRPTPSPTVQFLEMGGQNFYFH